jgi:hypothetical protein
MRLFVDEAALLALMGVAACRVPAARLPNRQVDDPITLPKATVAVSTRYVFDRPIAGGGAPDSRDWLYDGTRWGITNRLQVRFPAAVEYAVLDERPIGRPANRLSLAVRGGVDDLANGWYETRLQTMVGIQVGKRIAPRVALWAEATGSLVYRVRPDVGQASTGLTAYGGTTVQIVSRLALQLGGKVQWFAGRPLALYSRALLARRRAVDVTPMATALVRVFWWFDVGVTGGATRTRLRFDDDHPDLARPDEILPPLPERTFVTYHLGVVGTFRW